MSQFSVGQRCISNTEAALGLGIVTDVADRRVMVSFPAAAEERTYALDNAPLSRIAYQVGDEVKDLDGNSYTVTDRLDHNGLLIYKVEDANGDDTVLPEIELDCFVHFNSPKDRLLSGLIDPLKFFDLRQDALNHLGSYQQSDVVGLLGPRVQLLPHQLYIAHQVANRMAPRVLLADEVGLGKTIEAGLIVHQQLQSGLASRVLILVPDSLLHQWLVEMLRRFNLRFSVLDEAICNELQGVHLDEELLQADVEASGNTDNPFDSSQLVLCPLSFLVNNPQRLEQALACDWDLLLVDEAHHLTWSESGASAEYQCVERLAALARGVLLLTATPEQLGVESHFARLRLLDPDRYPSLQAFIAEEEQYQPVNRLVQQLLASIAADSLPQGLAEYLVADELQTIEHQFAAGAKAAAVDLALNALLDRHGTGRVLFRNTRAAVKGFPQRCLHRYPLAFNEVENISASISDWLQIESIFGTDWLNLDERVDWLLNFLSEHRQEKILLICARAETAIELENHLNLREGIRSAVFHERMSLINRDRAAAYFADPDESAQLLVCSEIGSEGRNFQFAHHIVLFDLPLNPDLLEQRIGRLDRIGQRQDIQIHLPYYENTAQQVLLDWYHQGLNAFEETCAIGHTLFERFQPELLQCLQHPNEEELAQLIAMTRQAADDLREQMHNGRDQLLELNSCRPAEADRVIDALLAAERRNELEDFVERSCDQLGIDIEGHSANAVILRPSDHMRCGNLPGLGDEGMTATYSRDVALSREDMHYLTWEHPFVQGAMDVILSGDHGNTAVGTVKIKPLKAGTLLLEALFTLHTIAPVELRLSRYIAANTVRVLVNLDGKDLAAILTPEKFSPLIESVPKNTAQALVKQAREPIETLIAHADKHAQQQLPQRIDDATALMFRSMQQEIDRLQALAEVNPNIRAEEVTLLEQQQQELATCISHAQLKLDAVRLVMAV